MIGKNNHSVQLYANVVLDSDKNHLNDTNTTQAIASVYFTVAEIEAKQFILVQYATTTIKSATKFQHRSP